MTALKALLEPVFPSDPEAPETRAQFEQRPEVTPKVWPYVVVVDQFEVGYSTRYEGSTRKQPHEWQVLVVSRTAAGVRTGVAAVRGRLRDLWLDGARLREVAAGPVLADGPEGDRRLSATLIYRATEEI